MSRNRLIDLGSAALATACLAVLTVIALASGVPWYIPAGMFSGGVAMSLGLSRSTGDTK